jgi:MvaI/BcnI restriction endonuclease family
MIASSDTDLSEVLPVFSSIGLRVAFLVPTETAMKKSIIDATSPLRDYLADLEFHHFDKQPQGEENKVLRQTFFVGADSVRETKTSLYRPPTKAGDPRICFYKLRSYAAPYNLLAVVARDDALYVINCSKPEILNSIKYGHSPLFALLGLRPDGLSPEALELLVMLQAVGQKGWTENLRAGDTGVGFTLETLLGISANSNKSPDYKGVEIKASRKKSSSQCLFSKTPNWNLSRLKGTQSIFDTRARYSALKNRHQLFHSVYADKPNSYEMQLAVDFESQLVTQFCLEAGLRVDDVVWEFEALQSALRKKHNQTFWVKSDVRKTGPVEEFWYNSAEYTRGPNVEMLPTLIDDSKMYVDFTIWQSSSGKATDQGYLFKMKKSNLDMLFGKPKVFDLSTPHPSVAPQ